MSPFLIWLAIAVQTVFAGDHSDQELLRIKSEEVVIKANGLLKWNQFELEVVSSRATFVDSVLSSPSNLDVIIYNAENEVVCRNIIQNTKIRPDPDKPMRPFDISGTNKIERTDSNEFTVRVFREINSSSSHHKFKSRFEFAKGSYSVNVQFRIGEERVVKSDSIALIVK